MLQDGLYVGFNLESGKIKMKNDETYQTDKFCDLEMLVTGGTNYTKSEEHLLYRKVLRAVVELHKPTPLDERGDVCLTCCPDLLTLYPCSTIQIIEKELK